MPKANNAPGATLEAMIHDRYRLIRSLGEGSSAQTWLAEDTQEARQVAVKLLRVEHLENWKYLELFEREAHVLASLSHHGVPRLFDFFEMSGEDDKAQLVLVQEYIEGMSLAERIESGPRLGGTETLQLALGVLDVLDYLHERTPPVYHRDLKPSNIIVRPMGAPVLVDFGSVCDGWRPVDERGSTIVGTHGFMPPEQYMGQVSQVSDLYGLGATLLFLMTGKHPREFSFDSGRIEVPDALPGDARLRTLVAALLEPAPRDRPQSASAARQLLLTEPEGPDATGSELARRHSGGSESTALAPYNAGGAELELIRSDDAPHPVDVGPPGRDTTGELVHVYRNLIPTHLRSIQIGNGKPSKPAGALDLTMYVFLLACTFGLWPIIAALVRRKRKSDYHDIFVNGVQTTGRVVSLAMQTNNGYPSVTYDFEVEGKRYRGSQALTGYVAKHVGVGDTLSVLYDPQDPKKNCFVYA